MCSHTFGNTEQPALAFPLQPYPAAQKQLCQQLASYTTWNHPEIPQGVSANYPHRRPYIEFFFKLSESHGIPGQQPGVSKSRLKPPERAVSPTVFCNMPGYRTQILCLSLGELQTQHFWGCLPSSPADRDTGRWAWSLAKVEELHWRQWWDFSFLQLPIWPSHFYKWPRGDDMKHKAWKSTELWLGNSPWHRLGNSSHKEFESRCEIPQSQDYSIPVSYVRQTSKINYWVNLAHKTQLTVSNSTRRPLGALYFQDMQRAPCLWKCCTLGAASQDHCSRQGRAADTPGFALCKYFLCPGSTETTAAALPVGWKVSHPEAAVGTQLTSSKQSLSGMWYPQFHLWFQVTKWRDAWNSYWVPRLLHA